MTTITINTDGDAAGLDDLTTEQLLERASVLDDEIETRTAEAIAPLKAQLDGIKDVLRARALAAGETLTSDAGRVEFVRAGERVTWNDKGLIQFAARIAESQPDLFVELLALRTVAPVEPSARVRFAPRPK